MTTVNTKDTDTSSSDSSSILNSSVFSKTYRGLITCVIVLIASDIRLFNFERSEFLEIGKFHYGP